MNVGHAGHHTLTERGKTAEIVISPWVLRRHQSGIHCTGKWYVWLFTWGQPHNPWWLKICSGSRRPLPVRTLWSNHTSIWADSCSAVLGIGCNWRKSSIKLKMNTNKNTIYEHYIWENTYDDIVTYWAARLISWWWGGRHNIMWRLVFTRDTKNLLGSSVVLGCSLFMDGPIANRRPSISSLVKRWGYSPDINKLLMASRYSSSWMSRPWTTSNNKYIRPTVCGLFVQIMYDLTSVECPWLQCVTYSEK